jgi:hypothetical protein
MKDKKTGGSAFPRRVPKIALPPDEALELINDYSGMTLRDYFAGQALNGLCVSIGEGIRICESDDAMKRIEQFIETKVAYVSYTLADAMIEERDK